MLNYDNLKHQEIELTSILNKLESHTLNKLQLISNERKSLQSLHAVIGSHNNQYLDILGSQFFSPEDFIEIWMDGLVETVNQKISINRFYPSQSTPYYNSTYMLVQLLKDQLSREYVLFFLKRNFYRHYKERTRSKPDNSLWELWFGNNMSYYGLFITPQYRGSQWSVDKSAMRRSKYNYWTIEHILQEGLVIPKTTERLKFDNLQSIIDFYINNFQTNSNSGYEKQIISYYIEYLKNSPTPMLEPFLIPELRFGGESIHHLYRLDFTILNYYTMKNTGFEISPASTHVHPLNPTHTPSKLNKELTIKWGKEMDKRTQYFKKYNITTITFTDKDLLQVKEKCFKIIQEKLSARNDNPVPNIEHSLIILNKL